MEEQETPDSGLEWRQPREQGFLKTLPSGHKAYLRPVTPLALIKAMGEIPDSLTPLAATMIYEGIQHEHIRQVTDGATERIDAPEAVERIRDNMSFTETICKLAFVNPRIVDNPQAADEISMDDIELQDRFFVLALATKPSEVLRRFRLQPDTDVEPIPDSQDDEQSTESVSEGDE